MRGRTGALGAAPFFEFEPTLGSFRMFRPVGRAQLADIGRQRIELGRPYSSAQFQQLRILEATEAVGDHNASETAGVRYSEIESCEASGGGGYEMDAADLQIIQQREQVAGSGAGLRSRGFDQGAAPTTAVEGEEAVSGGGECRNLIFPTLAGSAGGVEEYDRYALATRISIENPGSRHGCETVADLGGSGECRQQVWRQKNGSLQSEILSLPLRRRSPGRLPTNRSQAARRVKLTVVVSPGTDSTQIRPPYASTILRHMASPMPVPGILEPWRRLRGSNI